MTSKEFKQYMRRGKKPKNDVTDLLTKEEIEEALAAMTNEDTGPILLSAPPTYEYEKLTEELEEKLVNVTKKLYTEVFNKKFSDLIDKVANMHDPLHNLLDCVAAEDYFVALAADIYAEIMSDINVALATRMPKFGDAASQEKYEQVYKTSVGNVFLDIFPGYRKDFTNFINELLDEELEITTIH